MLIDTEKFFKTDPTKPIAGCRVKAPDCDKDYDRKDLVNFMSKD